MARKKSITIMVDAPVYEAIKSIAGTETRSASDLIREAMVEYLRSRNLSQGSLGELQPFSVGTVLKRAFSRAELMDEILGDDRD